MQLEDISGQTVLTNWAVATEQSGAALPSVVDPDPVLDEPVVVVLAEPVVPCEPLDEELAPPPQAPSQAVAARARRIFRVERNRETTAVGIGDPLSVQ
jgi:hypothetical protein